MNNYQKALTYIPAAMLVLGAFGDWEYGFYTLLRIIVTGAAAYLCYAAYKRNEERWALTYGGIAILFNPIIPIYLSRSTWQWIDVIAAGIFLYSSYLQRKTSEKLTSE